MRLSTTIFISLICFNSIFYTSFLNMCSGLIVWPTPQLCCCTLEFHLHYSYLIPITVILTMMLPMGYHSQVLLLLDSQLFPHSQPSGFLLCISMLHIYSPHIAHSQHLSPRGVFSSLTSLLPFCSDTKKLLDCDYQRSLYQLILDFLLLCHTITNLQYNLRC